MSEEKGPEPYAKSREEFLVKFLEPNLGHLEGGNDVPPHRQQDEVKNKLGGLNNFTLMPEVYGGDENKDWIVAGIQALAEKYPDQEGYIRGLLSGEIEDPHLRVDNIKGYYDQAFPEE